MVIKTVRFCARVVTVAVGLAAVLTTAVVLRLLSGPIDLEMLRPNLPNEFDTPEGRVRVTAEHIYAEWSGLKDPMRLVLTGLHIFDAQNREVATAPSVAFSFDARSAIRGRLLPTSIVVDRPTLDANITRDGGMLRRVLATSDSNSQGEFFELLIEQLMAEPNYHSVIGQLDTVEITNARLSLRDVPTGIVWVAPKAHARLKRDEAGVAISTHARFTGPTTDEPIDVSLAGTYARDRSRISFEAGLDGIKPSMLSGLSPDTAILRGVDIALSGRLRVEATGSGEVKTVALEVTAGSGTVILPGILPATHTVRSVSALAHVDAASHTARIDHINIDLETAKIAMTGTGLRTEQGQTFTGRAQIKDVPVDKLGAYWPFDFAEGGRSWALANLSNGSVDVATEFGLSTSGNDLEQLRVDRNVATLDYRGMTVRYMSHMPELQNVSGKARYEGDTLHFDVAGGTAVGLAVTGATIDMPGLNGPGPHRAELRIPIKGPASAVVALLARPRLGLPRDVLHDPKRVGGDAAVELKLAFPMINALTVGEIDINAEAAVSGFSLKDAIGAVDLTEAVGRIVYGNSQLNVTGAGKFDGSPVDFVWREQFSPRAPYRQRYELKGTIPADLIAKAGFASPEPYISGAIGVTSLSYQVATNGTGDLQGRFDLKGAKVTTPIGWSKNPGLDGQFTFGMRVARGGKVNSAEFEGRSNGVAAKGQMRFGNDNSLQQIAFSQLSVGATDINGEWRRASNGVDITLRGRSLEYARLREMLKAREELAKATPGGAAATARESTRFNIQLDRFKLEHGSLGSINGRLEMSGDRIVSADLGIGAGKGATFRVTPAGQSRNLSVFVADFGQFLKDSGWLDGFVAGDLDLRGRFDDAQAQSPLTGKLKLGPFRVEKATPRPGVGTLNSTIEALNRAGNPLQQFDNLSASITKVGERVELKDGHTSGKSIGLTTAGVIDLAKDHASLRGIVVPGFALNNVLSNVPLLGPLLTGGKDGGVFAIAYRLEGPLDNLQTDVNMMSAMTPGALREIFSGNASGDTPQMQSPSDRAP